MNIKKNQKSSAGSLLNNEVILSYSRESTLILRILFSNHTLILGIFHFPTPGYHAHQSKSVKSQLSGALRGNANTLRNAIDLS